MYTLSTESHFDAAHRLSNYDGKCKRLHGHRWVVKIGIKGNHLNDWGAVIDFGDIKKLLNETLDKFDHRTILDKNDQENLDLNLPEEGVVWLDGNPTAENISRYIFYMLSPAVLKLGTILKYVRVAESPTSYAEYRNES